MTAVPFSSDSTTFSASWPNATQSQNEVSTSFHSPLVLALTRREVTTVNRASGLPLAEKPSSGSAASRPVRVTGCSWCSP
jgi:hypothetical protein